MMGRFSGIRKAGCMLLALPAAFSFTYLLRTNQSFTMINHSIVSILLWWACWRVMARAEKCANRRLLCISLPLGLLFSMMMVFGAMVMQYQTARFFQLKTWAGVVCAAPLFTALVMLFVHDLPRARLPAWQAGERLVQRLRPGRFFLLCWGLIFLAWLPGWLASYPGMFGYDSVYQIDYYLKGAMDTRHPILHTWWLGLCVITLGDVLGSPEAGMAVYAITQMLAFSACLASIMGELRSRGTGAAMLAVCLALFMFMPINAIFSFSSTKDVMFTALVIWTLLQMLRMARSADMRQKPAAWARLAALGLGMCMLRNQGVYVFAFAMLFGLCLLKGARWKAALALVVLLAGYGVYQGPVSTLMKAERTDNVQEMLSVPLVQLSCARVYHADDLTPQQQADIERYIPQWAYYDSTSCGISDPVKNTFNIPLFRQDPGAFVKLWAQVGLQSPEAYIDAFLRLTAGWWYPDMNYRDWAAHHPYYEYNHRKLDGYLYLERSTPQALMWLHDLYRDLSDNNSDQKIPVLSLLTSSGLAAWVMLLFGAWAVYEKRWALLWPWALLFGLWGTLLLGPVVLLRYGYPLLLACPLWLCTMRQTN